MFYTLDNINTLLIDADDFWDQSELINQLISILEPNIRVRLVSRHHDSPHLYPSRTTVPHTMTEHLHFSKLFQRAIKNTEAPAAYVIYLCASIDKLERTKSHLVGTIFFSDKPLTNHEKHLLYMESPDFVVDSIDALLDCLSRGDDGFNAEFASDRSRLQADLFKTRSIPLNDAQTKSHSTSNGATTFNTEYSDDDDTNTGGATEIKSNFPVHHDALRSQMNSSVPDFAATASSKPDDIHDPVLKIVKLPNFQNPDSPFWVQGRYFGQSDPRHQFHALSLRIWHFKRHHEMHAALFAELYLDALDLVVGTEFDIITQVPARPEVGDRLAQCLQLIRNQIGTAFAERVVPDILRCTNSYPNLKSLNSEARRMHISKAFQVQKNISGKRIVVIDDVITTGATMNACITKLKHSGAASVTPLLLAYHPYAIKGPLLPQPTCTTCGQALRVNFNGDSFAFVCPPGDAKSFTHPPISLNEVRASMRTID